MELALVGHAPGGELPAGTMHKTIQRLRTGEWSAVYADRMASATASAVGVGLGVTVAVEPALSLTEVVQRNAGRSVVAVCDPDAIRTFVALAAGVPHDSVPVPAAGSVSRVRASRTGTYTLMSLNETLHLHCSLSEKGGIE